MIMLKISELSQEELKYICGRIPPAQTRLYFQKHPKEFAKIRPGFRAEKLSDADTISALVKNINKPFVSSFIELFVSDWLRQIQGNLDRLEGEGLSAGEALLKTMPESVFCDNLELYFKITEEDVDEKYIMLFRDALSFTQKIVEDTGEENLDEEDNSALLGEANATIIILQNEVAQYQKNQITLQKKIGMLEDQLMSCHDKEKSLSARLQDAETSLTEAQAELDYYKHLDNYADEEFEQDDDRQFQHVSIGQVSHDYNGQAWINRLADIDEGEIKLFVADDNVPHYFENRIRLYWRNGPEEDGTVGIWSWRADSRVTDATKDYITSEYNQNVRLTEIIEFPQCKTLSDLSKLITQWFEKTFVNDKVLFICTTANGSKEGLLCSPGNLEYAGTQARLARSVFVLPHYTVRALDIIKVAGIQVFRKMNLGIPQSVYRVRTPYDVIREMLLSRASITALRENGWSKKEAQKCRSYLEKIPTQSLVQELSDAYACTEDEAQEYVDSFLNNVDTYLSASDFDTHIFSIALERNPALIERCKRQLTDEWIAENMAMFEDAQKQFQAAQEATAEKKCEAELLNNQRAELMTEIHCLQQQIEDTEKFASDVEEKIADRIEEAKHNAAEFVSQMAFVLPTSPFVTQTEHHEHQPINVCRSVMENVPMGEINDIDTYEEELAENLEILGYEEITAIEIAQAVSFCLSNHIPIIVGENSVMIAQCVAASMSGSDLVEIYVSNQEIEIENLIKAINTNCSAEQSQVLLIHGAFDGYSISLFNALVNRLRSRCKGLITFLSIEGIPVSMIPAGVWNHAFYVDGDEGLQDITSGPVHSFDVSLDFDRSVDKGVFREKKKALSSYSSLIANTQTILYALYLSYYNAELKDSIIVLNQIIATVRSSGKEELLNSVFHEYGISNGEELLSRFL